MQTWPPYSTVRQQWGAEVLALANCGRNENISGLSHLHLWLLFKLEPQSKTKDDWTYETTRPLRCPHYCNANGNRLSERQIDEDTSAKQYLLQNSSRKLLHSRWAQIREMIICFHLWFIKPDESWITNYFFLMIWQIDLLIFFKFGSLGSRCPRLCTPK